MRINILLNIVVITLGTIIFSSCDDEVSSLGSNIRPDKDSIYINTDTVDITAKTISMNNRIYARTPNPVLGVYNDLIFGEVKSDYLTEFYCPKNISFDKRTQTIDSVFIRVYYSNFTGDRAAITGISSYEVNQPLDGNYYTDLNPSTYCNLSKPLGQAFFNIKDSPTTDSMRLVEMKLNNTVGNRFYTEWQNNPGTFENSTKLKAFFPGVYVTNTYGSGLVIEPKYTILDIHYSYKYAETDSIASALFRLSSSPSEVIQMNHAKNDAAGIALLTSNSDPNKSYIKSPAGVYTELTIPLQDIRTKIGAGRKLNAANFKLMGLTEEETDSKMKRPTNLLFVNKDSIANYFEGGKYPKATNDFSSILMQRNSGNNSYEFITTYGSVNSNLASLINHYIENTPSSKTKLEFLVIPVYREVQVLQTQSGYTYKTSGVYNLMSPSSAIFRTDKTNMQLGLIFSEYAK